jgi:hypothetical protein
MLYDSTTCIPELNNLGNIVSFDFILRGFLSSSIQQIEKEMNGTQCI